MVKIMARRKSKLKSRKLLSAVIVFLFVVLTGIFGIEENPGKVTNPYIASESAYVHFIDVGQGSSTLIQYGTKGVLIDSGEADYSDKVIHYINSCGVDTLDYVIASHPHSDHIGGMTDIFDEFTVNEVIMPELSEINIPTTKLYENFLTYIDDNNIGVSFAQYGDTYTFEGFKIDIFGPVKQVKDLNSMSVICKVEINGTSFMFSGDAENQEMRLVAEYYPDLESDVMLVSHHGSNTALNEDYLGLISADTAVISCGKDNSYGHPHEEVLSYLRKENITVYSTAEDGTIVFECNADGYTRVY